MKNLLKALSLTCFSLIPLLSPAQTDSVRVLRFTYDFTKLFTERNGHDDRMNLDVLDNGSSAFYSVYSDNPEELKGIENKSREEVRELFSSVKIGSPDKYYRDMSRGELTFTTTQPTDFYYKEKIADPAWTIAEGDTTTLCGYLCQKATTTYAGRTWTVWFAEDIPVNAGPWKLGGLPGLIMDAYDADSLFRFTCVGMEQATVAPWHPDTKGKTKCTSAEYQKQWRLFDADPTNYILRLHGLPPVTSDQVTRYENGVKVESNAPRNDTRFYLERLSDDKM